MNGRKIALVAALVLVGFVAGSAIREFTPLKQAGVGAAIGIPSLTALFGMLWVANSWKDALTASIVVAYLIFLAGILSIFVFPQTAFEIGPGAKLVLDNFTGLVAVVFTGYFGLEAVRAAAQAYSNGRFFGPGAAGDKETPPAPPTIDP